MPFIVSITGKSDSGKTTLILKLLPELKKKGGIYAFWWIGEKNELTEALISCDYKLKGKQSEKELIPVKFTKEWINIASIETTEICLCIGKSTDITGRISKHIKLGTENIWEKINIAKNSGVKPNTESQLRIGLERVFNKSILNGLINNIGVSWIILDEYKNGINRFYLEDYFIGKYLLCLILILKDDARKHNNK